MNHGCPSKVLVAAVALSLWLGVGLRGTDPAWGFSPALLAQDGGGSDILGKLRVPPEKMACTTKVSPRFPQVAAAERAPATVVVRVLVSTSGNVTPLRAVSGQPVFQAEAMNAVRLWHFKPFFRDGEAIDVTTEVQVDFVPGRPAGMVTHPTS
jgi:TonB family protein